MRCALPDKIVTDPKGRKVNLKDAKHWDWPFFLRWIPRSWNATGPRCAGGSCECGGKGYKAWPPKLVEGFGVSRWESTEAKSIIEIPDFRNVKIGPDIYGMTFDAVERLKGHPEEGQTHKVTLRWEETRFTVGQLFLPQGLYSPSAIQSFSQRGYMVLDPKYKCWWQESPFQYGDEEKEALVLASGERPDHLDVYYNRRLIYAGFHYE